MSDRGSQAPPPAAAAARGLEPALGRTASPGGYTSWFLARDEDCCPGEMGLTTGMRTAAGVGRSTHTRVGNNIQTAIGSCHWNSGEIDAAR